MFEGVEGGVEGEVAGGVGVVIEVLTDCVVMVTLSCSSLGTSFASSSTSWGGGDVCKEGSVVELDVVVRGVGDVEGAVVVVRNVDGGVESGMVFLL